MNKVYKLFAAFLLVANAVSAQYYVIPNIGAGTNPGGLNNDTEYPVGGGLSTTWTPIKGTSAVPEWSFIQTIPFPFSFNASPVSQFKVSNSGVLTFTTSATAVPPFGGVSLPNANIPDNSVCVLGIRGNGANDSIVYKVFGSSPNRQLWVLFSSYSVAASATAYTYWSIVLEETSNNIYIVDQRHNPTITGISAGIQINPSSAVMVAGSPNLSSQAGFDPSPIDNTFYEFVQGVQPANEAKLKSLILNPYVVVPGSTFIEGVVSNLGASTINTMDVKYESNGNTFSATLSGLNIASGADYQFTHTTPLSVANATQYPLKVWVDLAGDANHANDTLNSLVTGLAFQTSKRVLIEEGTGTWCGWCPRGAVYTEQIDTVYPGSAIVVAVHNADPMTNSVYDVGMGNLISGYPSGLVDRKDIDVDPTDFGASYLERVLDVSPADVGVSAFFNSTTRQVDVVVSSTFAADLSGDFRLSAILVEDDVTGTSAAYNQANYYSFQSNNIPLVGAGHNWQTETNPVPAANMHYEFVGREVLGGFDGQAGSVPSSVSANSTYSYSFTTTIPAAWDASEMRVIGVLLDGATGHVLNVNRGSYGITTSVQELNAAEFSMSLYPNPAADNAQLEINLEKSGNFTVEVFDMIGKAVYNHSYSAMSGKNIINLPVQDLNSGVYIVKVNVGGSVLSSRLVVN